MDDGKNDEPDTEDALIASFIQANHEALTEDPAQALERLNRFLARLPAISDDDRRKVREAVLGSLK